MELWRRCCNRVRGIVLEGATAIFYILLSRNVNQTTNMQISNEIEVSYNSSTK